MSCARSRTADSRRLRSGCISATWRSRSTLIRAIVAAFALPFTPIAPILGFGAVPASFVGGMALIVFLYIVAAEAGKRFFYRLPVFCR
jgi:hypothetical protein